MASGFAEIFLSNSVNNGLVPVTLGDNIVDRLFREVEAREGYTLHIDLAEQILTTPDDETIGFEFEPSLKHRLLGRLDDITLSLWHADQIRAYETRRRYEEPWLFLDMPR